MTAVAHEQPDASTPIWDSHLDELNKLRELLGDVLEYLDQAPDRAVVPGSVLYHSIKAAVKS